MIRIRVRAPSNIALVKYMGKKPGGKNLPENPSLSFTLSHRATELWLLGPNERTHVSFSHPDFVSPKLSAAGEQRFQNFYRLLREELPAELLKFGFRLREHAPELSLHSANSFPEGAGFASSASSFAALTLATAVSLVGDPLTFQELYRDLDNPRARALRRVLASFSRLGSGSSCRSFEGPLVSWDGEETQAVELSEAFRDELLGLRHVAVLLSRSHKEVGSSEAHQRVKSSPHWEGRTCRASDRFEALETYLRTSPPHTAVDALSALIEKVSALAWEEFQDMHELFHTSKPAFSYFQPETRALLTALEPYRKSVIVTMDAGPNIHLFGVESAVQSASQALVQTLQAQGLSLPDLLWDRLGQGAEILEILESPHV